MDSKYAEYLAGCKEPPLLTDVGSKDTQRAMKDLEAHNLSTLFSYRQAYFLGAKAQHDINTAWLKAKKGGRRAGS